MRAGIVRRGRARAAIRRAVARELVLAAAVRLMTRLSRRSVDLRAGVEALLLLGGERRDRRRDAGLARPLDAREQRRRRGRSDSPRLAASAVERRRLAIEPKRTLTVARPAPAPMSPAGPARTRTRRPGRRGRRDTSDTARSRGGAAAPSRPARPAAAVPSSATSAPRSSAGSLPGRTRVVGDRSRTASGRRRPGAPRTIVAASIVIAASR